MSVATTVCGMFAATFAGLAGAGASSSLLTRYVRKSRRLAALGLGEGGVDSSGLSTGAGGYALRYAEELTRKLYVGTAEPLSLAVRSGGAARTRMGKRYLELALSAGCEKEVSVQAFYETSTRFGLVAALVGALLGVVLSTELAILLGCAGFFVGRGMPMRSLKEVRRKRAIEADMCLSEMLEVVALGLRSGLSFDLSFAFYGSHFEGGFARSCALAYRRWAIGLMTREESLTRFARSYDSDQLGRVVDGILRSLKLGTSLTGVLEDAAAQARTSYHAALEERIAKAPVKMMLPTGALILPAMLLMVIGPVLLELAGGF